MEVVVIVYSRIPVVVVAGLTEFMLHTRPCLWLTPMALPAREPG